jgi:hypothetical protein
LKGVSKEGLAAATEKALKFLAGYGISEERVLAVLGKPKHEWASEDIAALRGMASQLKDGQATAEHLFPILGATEEGPKAESKAKRPRAPRLKGPRPQCRRQSFAPGRHAGEPGGDSPDAYGERD